MFCRPLPYPHILKNLPTIFSSLFCRISCNSFTITNAELNTVGIGIYQTASLLNHSCDPNCVALFDGRDITIRAIKPIPSGKRDENSLLWKMNNGSVQNKKTNKIKRQSLPNIIQRQILPKDSPGAFDWKRALLMIGSNF